MQAMVRLNQPVTKNYLIFLFACAFIIRAVTFSSYVRYEERYKQSDSLDYHHGALFLAHGFGMTRPDTGEPIFWRVPGYGSYLVPFYKIFGITDTTFSGASEAQQASIWFQIFLSALLPMLLLFLAFQLTHSWWIAHITAWLSVIHLGFVLASTYLLTEAIAMLPFYLFFLYFYRSFTALYEQPDRHTPWIKNIVLAAIMLAIQTWIRPMGQYVAIVAALIIFLFAQDTIQTKLKKITLFLLLFGVCISPWYIRNYNLTGRWFFCPMFGTYLNSFCAPRIISETENIELIDAWKRLGTQAELSYRQLKPSYNRIGLSLPKEFVCGSIAWPIFLAHPCLALYDWMREVLKTTFDLYASQLVDFVRNTYTYDPLIEYISEKFTESIYSAPMHWSMRMIVYLELIYAFLLWVGLFGGFFCFMLMPCIQRFKVNTTIKRLFGLWIKVTPMIAAVVFMTGGFGYARLRLPVEGLMIILSLTFWQWLIQRKKTKERAY